MLEDRLAALTAAIDRLATVLENVPAPEPEKAFELDQVHITHPRFPEPEPEPIPEPEPEPEPEPAPEPEPEPAPAPKAKGKAAPKAKTKTKAEASPEVTRMDVRAALVRLAELTSQNEARAVLESVGQANTISDLDPDLYAEVVDAANSMSDKLEDL